jgi:4-hydroxythreonine-4-phosphate dehydrogenase
MEYPRIAVTPGEPAGIGLDLVIELAAHPLAHHLVIIADPNLLAERAKLLKKNIQIVDVSVNAARTEKNTLLSQQKDTLLVLPIYAATAVTPGKPAIENASYLLATLERALNGCLTGEFDAMCTGPIHKSVICQAGIPFSGHTEFLAEKTQAPNVVMMLACERLKVTLVTTHLPLSKVAEAITIEKLTRVIRTTHQGLKEGYGINAPRIAVLGLNPHAGENGTLGQEEINVIIPTIELLKHEGMQLTGPLSADTAFTPKKLNEFDAFIAMYHDQGLPVLKHIGFGKAVNVSLGLPIIRTSVDHGTALELAGTGKAESGSFIYAIETAIELARHKNKRPPTEKRILN